MNILISGGAGYIGSSIAHKLIDQKHRVTIIDNLSNGYKFLLPKKAKFYKCNISQIKKIKKIIINQKFDALIHLAGLVKVEESIKNPKKYYRNNYLLGKKFVQGCLDAGIKNIIFSSTAGVYGNTKHKKKIKENSILKPLNPYAKSKMLLEKFLLNLTKKYKFKVVILRYFNVAGAEYNLRSGLVRSKKNLIKNICYSLANNKTKFTINGSSYRTIDGTPVRDFIHISDLVNIHLKVIKKISNSKVSNVYNCGYGSGFSVKQVINTANNLTTKKLKIIYGPKRKGDISYSVSDVSKFKKEFSWKPKYNNLSKILKSSIEWEKKLRFRR